MPSPRRTNSRKVLLVEGADDREVVYHLSNRANIPRDSFSVVAKDGYKKLVESLPAEVDASEIEQLGILIDADTNIENRWESIVNCLYESGYLTLPDTPSASGIIVSESAKPRLGIWIMPNNQIPGMLEDFVSFLILPSDNLWQYATQAVEKIPQEQRRFIEQDISKARIHTWLAWQKEPGTPLGLAITRKYLDTDSLYAQAFLDWLRRLFDLA